jgi:hypothetical protein
MLIAICELFLSILRRPVTVFFVVLRGLSVLEVKTSSLLSHAVHVRVKHLVTVKDI